MFIKHYTLRRNFFNYFLIGISLSTLAFSCQKDEDEIPEPVIPTTLEVKQVNDLVADTGKKEIYTFYSLRENKIIDRADSATTNWDIAFKGVSIIFNSGSSGPGNGGTQIIDGIFDEVSEAPASAYLVDAIGTPAIQASSDKGWYHYTSTTPPEHAVFPIAGKIIIVKTADGKYAKLEIISYYRGNPNTTTAEFADLATRPKSRHYTFRYVYQPDGSIKLK